MKQGNRPIQRPTTRTRLTPQQVLNSKVTQMPIEQLEVYVQNQMLENPALESIPSENAEYGPIADAPLDDGMGGNNTSVEENSMTQPEDRIPVGNFSDRPERVFGNTVSFLDKLNEQVGEHELTVHQQQIMNYLIGSLDGDGLLRKSTESLADEMTVYENLETTPDEVATVLEILQSFEPAGIGAQSLQQCLLIQIDRKEKSEMQQLMHTVVEKYFDDFMRNHWNQLQTTLDLSTEKKERLQAELKRLNPKPGSSLGETQGFSIDRIIPDFIVETTDDGRVTFSLNNDHLPELIVAPSYTESLNDSSARSFIQKGINEANSLITALQQRQETMTKTMKAIIKWQYHFFQDGDESELRPLKLEDIAKQTGLDISTISRVTNEKYAQTRWGIFQLRFFFTDKYTNENGEELSTRKMKLALKDIIDNEDKQHPLSDEALEKKMNERGFDIKRRTITKYRDQMGIPKASLRKE